LSAQPTTFTFASRGATHVGAVRSLNEGAFLDDSAAGIWAVADGVGGASAGDYASNLVVRSLARIGVQANAMALLGAVRERLDAANADLLAFAVNEGASLPAARVISVSHQTQGTWKGHFTVLMPRSSVCLPARNLMSELTSTASLAGTPVIVEFGWRDLMETCESGLASPGYQPESHTLKSHSRIDPGTVEGKLHLLKGGV